MRVLKWSRNFKKLEYDNRVGEGGESTMAPTRRWLRGRYENLNNMERRRARVWPRQSGNELTVTKSDDDDDDAQCICRKDASLLEIERPSLARSLPSSQHQ